jgi:hypothetical protein
MLKKLFLATVFLGTMIIASEAHGQRPPQPSVQGDCGTISCDALVEDLRDRYPEEIKGFEQSCLSPDIRGLDLYPNESSEKTTVDLICWNGEKEKGTRMGFSRGILPFPSTEAEFLTTIPESPYSELIQQRYPQEVKSAQFQCAGQGGEFFQLYVDETKQQVELDCIFSVPADNLDFDDDFTILATFNVGEEQTTMQEQSTPLQSNDFCELPADYHEAWSLCVGEPVKVKGKMPKLVMQHVDRTFNPVNGQSISQGYIDALDYQFVLLSEQPISCQGEFEVEGVLNLFALEGDPNTKDGYSNYEIHVKQVTCLESHKP